MDGGPRGRVGAAARGVGARLAPRGTYARRPGEAGYPTGGQGEGAG